MARTSNSKAKTAKDAAGARGSVAGALCPVAGIGASAGGLEAFTRLLNALPAHIGMALMLVQHLDPTQESMLAGILGRAGKLPVSEATHGMRVEADHVYVIPPNATMRLSRGSIALEERPKAPAHVLPVDTLFRSIGDECGSLSIGVVLSGTGTDGAMGLAAIKEAGGLTFVQDPSTAEYEGMPRASAEAGVVDETLDIEGIAAELVRLGTRARAKESHPSEKASAAVDEEPLAQILSLVRGATGLDLSSYRRTTLMRRVKRRMLLEGAASMQDYLRVLRERPPEVEALYRDVLVDMTEFFRDPDVLDAVGRGVFPELLERKGSAGPIRIWVPGCSKGQEAYSILISLVELLDGKASSPEIQMFATDVNEQDVEFARAGVYPQGIAREVSPERLARFFVQVPGGYRIDRSIREMCVFAVHDVTRDPPFSRLDLISFRNVLIYMERPLQGRVLQIMHYALEPSGFLLLGSSETVGTDSALFSVIDKRHRVYRRMPGSARLLSALAHSPGGTGSVPPGSRAGPGSTFDVLEAADEVVQGGYQPAGILVTAALDVLQFRGHVGPYIDPAEGMPELKLPRLVAPGLASTVEAAIREAAETKAAAKRGWTAPERDGARREIDVEAVPITAPTGESYYLVLFGEQPRKTRARGSRSKRGGDRANDVDEASRLRRELDETREQLDTLVSEKAAANADLRAASERFQSSNEELRTINEEFQTAQEELQSTNEELTTLNDELRNRNTELGRLADDLNNVIEGVEIPILILDTELRIRRFTPQAGTIVSIVPSDVGRPITDLSLKADVPDLKGAVRKVLRKGAPSQTEVRSVEGRWYWMRIRPYRTSEGKIDGVVIAFLDIDEQKKSTETAEAAREHAEAVVETVREPLLTLGPDLRVREANSAFYGTFAVSAEDTIGRPLFELGGGHWDFPELRALLEQILPRGREFAGLEAERDLPGIGRRVMRLYARRVREEHGKPSILLAIDDVTELRRRERLSTALNNISLTIGSTLEFDQLLERVLRQSSEALGADSAAVLLNHDGKWVMQNAYGLPRKLLGRVLDERRVSAAMALSETGDPVAPDPAQGARFLSSLGVDSAHASVLVVPLLLREEQIGLVSFHQRSIAWALGDPEMDFARRLSTVLSLAFESARLFAAQREIADTLQAALLTIPRRVRGVDFGYLYRSATVDASVGGDFYDIFELDRGRVGVLIGDVSGKGVQAATLTALVKNTVRALAYENDSPAAVVTKTNTVIVKATPASTFVTLVFCILDTASGRLVYCSAGHTHGIVKKGDGGIELLEVGSPLAGAFDPVEFRDGETAIENGDVLFLYTDGVTEARRDEELFGEERLVASIRHMAYTTPKKMPKTVLDEVLRFTGGALSDDVAIVSVAMRKGRRQ